MGWGAMSHLGPMKVRRWVHAITFYAGRGMHAVLVDAFTMSLTYPVHPRTGAPGAPVSKTKT